MEDVAAIVGSIAGVVSLLGIIYMIGWWKGQVDTKLRNMTSLLVQYPPAETALMAKTLWDIYVVDALRDKPNLATSRSAFKLSDESHSMIPEDIKRDLGRVEPNPGKEAIASGYLVVKTLGIDRITEMAKNCKSELTVQETIAILSVYLDEQLGGTE